MLQKLLPHNIVGQLMLVLSASFLALLAILAGLELLDQDDAVDWAKSDYAISRLSRLAPILPRLREGEQAGFIDEISKCHEGYTLTPGPFPVDAQTVETASIEARISQALVLPQDAVKAGFVRLDSTDFSYGDCSSNDITLPVEGIVISIRISDQMWLNAEVHPHEWHFTPSLTDWLIRSTLVFLLVGTIGLIFVWRIGSPLNALARAARAFGDALQVDKVAEAGPPDVRHVIQSFNDMQTRVAGEVQRRTTTLAAIGHDIRTPLTALRLKTELIEDVVVRSDMLTSIQKMERITVSALEYLRGEFRDEPKKRVDLASLVESECSNFQEGGARVTFSCKEQILLSCRPVALSRAVSNLIENAVKYAGHADVLVSITDKHVQITITDHGPGISVTEREKALEPFERLSLARESESGGFGLGLAIVKMITEGHSGTLTLGDQEQHGLVATITLPLESHSSLPS